MAKNKSFISNVSWKFAERITAQIVTTIVSIIIATILNPEDYGIIAIVNIFITIANVFVSDGLGSALIQKKDADALDFSSILYFNIFFSCVLYAILFFTAPLISRFYGDGFEILTPVIRVLGIRLIFSAINSIQQAYVAREMIFKKFFWATIIGTIISAVVGIWMALSGYGVWALVAQYLTNVTVDTVALIILLHKRPLVAFSWKRVKKLIGFGSKVLGTNLLITGYSEMRGLLIGKLYSKEDLAFYERGNQFPSLIITNVNSSISAVLFPKMSDYQEDKAKVKEITKMSIRMCSFIFAPMMFGLLAVAPIFVAAILKEKWLPCVPFIQLLAMNYLFYPIHSANMSAIKAMKKGTTLLVLEIVKKVVEIGVLFIVLWYGVNAIVIGMVACSTAFVFVNAWPNKKIIGYSVFEQIKDTLAPLLMSTAMAVPVYFMKYLPIPLWIILILQIICGIGIYFGLAFLTKNKELSFLIKTLKEKVFNKKSSKEVAQTSANSEASDIQQDEPVQIIENGNNENTGE